MTPKAQSLAVVVLAAGKGKRMKSNLAKVLHAVAGRSLLGWVLAAARALDPARLVVVLGKEMDEVARAAQPATIAIQDPPRGTGHAVMAAAGELKGFKGDVLVVFADTPMLTADTLRAMVEERRKRRAGVVCLGFRPQDPTLYGRLVTARDGSLLRIVEHKDAGAAERRIGLCNAGAMCLDGALLPKILARLRDDNAQGEYYLTDAVGIARKLGRSVGVVEASENEVMGVDTRAKLAAAEAVAQGRLRAAAMEAGATLIGPETVYLAHDTVLGRDVTVGPFAWFGPGVTVEDEVTIKAFCHLEGAQVARGAIVGPYARLRPGARIGRGVHIGNFVEVKAATIEDGAKVNHLTYVGDARVGRRTNVGAGTITCNYDGFAKHFTDIGADVFVGSNSALVAPVRIGDGAMIGAGSVVTRDVASDALAVERSTQSERPGWAAEFRARRAAEKLSRKG
ncbi:MAG: bifunctional UDP-N-acetylglucosamine diphosphorylase/glucosamine-1-phosphate N-acetyltransferase GlmU [Alphaproteobacteria bacterium]|nr:bifunctional UDP-N-acetylglucosamine diphosphorylase/glucosamine-1-phosphate N-acetyltransferase GlmU [Alphaproteobacteria bacterium]